MRLRGLAVGVVCALAWVGGAGATDFGANDDTGKYAPDAGAAFYREMASLGLRQTVITVRWLPSDPLGLGERTMLGLTVAAARSAGLRVIFATYPYPPREIESGLALPEAFGEWLRALALSYPEVREFVVGNEPNQPAFWRPQFTGNRQVSAQAFGPFLAAGYDALKTVDPTLTVVGVGLSPRGNDKPGARSNISTSPVRFLQALGAWYRASGRDRPLMDGLSFHPYPNRATDPLSRGYPWPNAGFVNLGRIKQALWDAFAGTTQPTTAEGLRLYLDEVGWQVDTAGRDGYGGDENVPVTDEASQAAVYGELVRTAACDPDVAAVNIFGFEDDPLRTGFQAGLVRADGSLRPSASAVGEAIGTGVCPASGSSTWRPTSTVVGAARPRVTADATGVDVALGAAEAARARVCLLQGTHGLASARRYLASRTIRAGTCAGASVKANQPVTVHLARSAGTQTVAVGLSAEANPTRVTTAVRILRPRTCLTANICSGTLRTDVRQLVPQTHRAARAGHAVPLGASRR